MDAQDFRSLQEAYIGVYDDDIREKLEFESWVNNLLDEGYDLSDYTQLHEISDKLATAARNLRQKRYTKSADQARNLQLSKGNRADMFYKNFDKTVKLNDTLKSRKKRTGTEIPRVEQLDLYDIILSHLLDEGYADTQEAAERIMVNMSKDWRESIVEGDNYDKNRQRAAKRAAERNEARKRGQTGNVPGIGYVSPRPERETYRDAAGVERHTSGARMPQK